MSNNQLVEVTGIIKNLLNKGNSYTFYFTLQDDHNRLLTVKYEHENYAVSNSLYDSLKEGISRQKQKDESVKVQILIEGPMEETKDYYVGVGPIKILN